MANCSNASSPTIRKFAFDTAPRSSAWLYVGLVLLGGLFFWHEYYCAGTITAALLSLCVLTARNTVTQGGSQAESLIAIKGIGVQLTKVSKKGSAVHMFLDCTQIKDVVINEVTATQGMTPYSVYFYLALIVQNSDRMIVPFEVAGRQNVTLRLEQVKEVYYGVRELLFST